MADLACYRHSYSLNASGPAACKKDGAYGTLVLLPHSSHATKVLNAMCEPSVPWAIDTSQSASRFSSSAVFRPSWRPILNSKSSQQPEFIHPAVLAQCDPSELVDSHLNRSSLWMLCDSDPYNAANDGAQLRILRSQRGRAGHGTHVLPLDQGQSRWYRSDETD